jgi:hypothetical protein
MKQHVKAEGPVPSYLTAGKVYEAEFDAYGHFWFVDDRGSQRISAYPCTPSLNVTWSMCDAEGNPVTDRKPGKCRHDDHPDYCPYCAIATRTAERDRWKAIAGELAEALRSATQAAEFEQHPARPWHYDAKAALAKYEQEKGA